jgi:hypothetical protein
LVVSVKPLSIKWQETPEKTSSQFHSIVPEANVQNMQLSVQNLKQICPREIEGLSISPDLVKGLVRGTNKVLKS